MAKEPRLGLHNLKRPRGASSTPKRKGRGQGTGLGKTAGRGTKGQRARKSGNVRPGFEGGQMPLIRRIPKRGFINPFKIDAQVVNLRDLGEYEGEEVTPALLVAGGYVGHPDRPVKILGMGDAKKAFVVKGCGVSASARQKIEAAGGRVEA